MSTTASGAPVSPANAEAIEAGPDGLFAPASTWIVTARAPA